MKSRICLILAMVSFLGMGISQFAFAATPCSYRTCLGNSVAVYTCLQHYNKGICPYSAAVNNCCYI